MLCACFLCLRGPPRLSHIVSGCLVIVISKYLSGSGVSHHFLIGLWWYIYPSSWHAKMFLHHAFFSLHAAVARYDKWLDRVGALALAPQSHVCMRIHDLPTYLFWPLLSAPRKRRNNNWNVRMCLGSFSAYPKTQILESSDCWRSLLPARPGYIYIYIYIL